MATVKELKAQAKAKGLKGYSKMRKAELEKLVGNGKKKASPSKGASPKKASPPKKAPKKKVIKKKLNRNEIIDGIYNDEELSDDMKEEEQQYAQDEDEVDEYNDKVLDKIERIVKESLKKNKYTSNADAIKKIMASMDRDAIINFFH